MLFEKSDVLGGNLRTAGFHSFKREVSELNDWYQRELVQAGVEVHMGEEATPQKVLALGFRPASLDASGYHMPGVDVYQIGDGRQVGNIMTAIWEAYEVARGL